MAVVAAALALRLAPDPIIKPAAWAADNLVVADGPYEGRKWSPDLTPYVVEILNNLAVESPYTRISVRKSAQTGLTEAGIAWIGSIIAETPSKAMIVFPTLASVDDFNKEKLTPTIEATAALSRRIREHKSRSAQSSTARNKRFPGGSLVLTGANSAADLRSKTVRYLFADEIDEWPLDLDGQGDPMEMAKARQTAFHATADYKLFEASTPRIRGASRIDDAFEEGDQRYWHVPCPHCGEKQRLVFGSKDSPYGLKFETTWPYQARYVCRHCGAEIEHHEKRAMVMAGEFIAESPGPGKHPSYHIDSLISLLTTWDKIAETFLKAKASGDPAKLKTFVNLWLGEAWEERGDAPEWNRLYARRETNPRRSIPAGGLVLTAAADVQGDGLYYEVLAWGPNEESWSIDVGFLPGDTASDLNPVWQSLAKVFLGTYPDAYGNRRPIDLCAVDSGFNTSAVYGFVRKYSGVLAVKGADGWGRAPIGTVKDEDVNLKGKKKRRGLKVWQIGTWSLKSKFYAYLRGLGLPDGEPVNPPGYCHFGEFHDEGYFQQITNEFLKDVTVKGRTSRVWWEKGPNHYLDCRIYNMALAAHPLLQLPNLTADDWRQLARDRAVPMGPAQGDLETVLLKVAPDRMKSESKQEQETSTAQGNNGAGSGGYLGTTRGRPGGWLSRR